MKALEGRISSIDGFRGFAILTMVLANFLAGVRRVPAWLKHAPDAGLTVIDLIAPFFILAIGLTCRPSVVRAAAGLALLAGYQALLDLSWRPLVLASPHGGILGSLSWSAMLLLATALADLFHGTAGRAGASRPSPAAGRWLAFPAAGLAVLMAGIALAFLVPVSKNRVSASYVLVSLGIGCLLFEGFHLLCDGKGLRIPLLPLWGRNPLAFYVLHGLLLALVVLPGVPGWYAEAPAWLTALQAAGLVAALSAVGRLLDARGWVLSL